MKPTSTSLVIAILGATSIAALAAQPIVTQTAREQRQASASVDYFPYHLDVGVTRSDVSEPSAMSRIEPMQISDTDLLRYLHDIATKRSILFPASTPQ